MHSFIIHEGSFQLVKQGRFGPLDAWGCLKSLAELQFLKTCAAIHSYYLGFVPQREQFPLTMVKCLCPNENGILEHAMLVAVQVISFIKKNKKITCWLLYVSPDALFKSASKERTNGPSFQNNVLKLCITPDIISFAVIFGSFSGLAAN